MLLTPGVIAGAPLVPRLINHPFRYEREREDEGELGKCYRKGGGDRHSSFSEVAPHHGSMAHSGNVLKINLY